MGDQEESNEMDYEKVSQELAKAGLVTKSDLAKAIQEGLKGVKLSEGIEKAAGNYDMKDIMRHIKDGGCEDEDCSLGKATNELYRSGFVKGTYYGVKLGQYGQSKGVTL